MALQIPLIESQRQVDIGGIDVYSNPEQFGAGIGREIKNLGGAVMGLAGKLSADAKAEKDRQEARDRNERLAVGSAAASIELARINKDRQLEAPADGTGTTDKVLQEQREYIERTVSTIKDPIERQALKIELTNRLPAYASNNLDFEVQRTLKNQEDVTNFTLNGLENLVRTDAAQHDTALADGLKIINSKDVPAGMKEGMSRNWTQRVANVRFQGLLEAAKTPEDFDVIAKQLTEKGSKWQDAFTPQEFTSTLDEIGRAKKAFVTQADVTARAALESAEARMNDMVELDPAEITQINEMADRSGNPISIKRARRVERNNIILQKWSKLAAHEQRARAAQLKDGGFPGMPPEVNTAIQKATTIFPSVSAAYLGGNIVEEYGKYLPRTATRRGNEKFAPRVVGANVDLRLMQPKALNATILAGEIYGEPLDLISAHRTAKRQEYLRFAGGKNPNRAGIAKRSHHTAGDAIDASTVGMSGVQKAKLVDALLQAGFTGIGEYDTHIHADMRDVTPGTFNAQSGWLGWSKGSPEVVAAMVARGYAPGVEGAKLSRGTRAQELGATPVDYTKGATGGGTSAVGPGQWTEKSFLGVVKDPKIAQRIGLPPNMSDAQLLELRKDPTWSMMATAAYAEQNKKILETVLQRPVIDAELYMAHLLGPTGAQRLIAAYTNDPDSIAADSMEIAAKNNPPRFYADGGKGKALTHKEVYDNIAIKFGTAPNQIQYEDAQQYEKMATAAKKAQDTDPMTHYSNNVAPVNDLNVDGGYSARGAVASAAAGLYKIPVEEMKPFTADEAADLTKRMAEGTSEQKLAIMRNIETMDQAKPGLALAAYTQLGQKDTAVSHAAALANERKDEATAEQIVRGQDRLKNDKQLENSLYGDAKIVSEAFNTATDGALLSIQPNARNAIFDAAKALYAEKQAQAGSYTFDETTFKAAVVQVIGGTASPGLEEVNGKLTMLPPGITGDVFDTAVNKMTDSDLLQFSRDGNPPINIEGDTILAADIAREGEFVYVGEVSYTVRMNDGRMLVTGERLTNGTLQAFVFEADVDEMKKLANRPAPVVPDMAPLGAGEAAPVPSFTGIPGVPELTPAQKALEGQPGWND